MRFAHLLADINIRKAHALQSSSSVVTVSVHRRKSVCVVSLYSTRGGQVAVIGMNGQEQLSALLVGNLGAPFQSNVRIILACVDDLGSQPILQQISQPFHHIERQIFFQQSLPPYRPQVPPPVAGIEHNPRTRHLCSRFTAANRRRRSKQVNLTSRRRSCPNSPHFHH